MKILPFAIMLLLLWIFLHALNSTSHEMRQWPRRLLRFILAIIAGIVIFSTIYLIGGALVSNLGYTHYDGRLLRLAHLVCILGAYPAGMVTAAIFRTKHSSLILAFSLVIMVHLLDHGTYFGKMVFDDPAIPLNGDFSLTNMALMLISALIGGEVGLRRGLKSVLSSTGSGLVEAEPPDGVSLTSDGA
jgi:hypothetical protein